MSARSEPHIRPAALSDLDAGVEDKVLGEGLYRAIIGEMVARLDRRRAGRR